MTLQSWTNTCLLTTPRTSFVGRKLIRLHNIWLVLLRWWVSYLWPASKSMKLQISPNYCEKSSKITFLLHLLPPKFKESFKICITLRQVSTQNINFLPPFHTAMWICDLHRVTNWILSFKKPSGFIFPRCKVSYQNYRRVANDDYRKINISSKVAPSNRRIHRRRHTLGYQSRETRRKQTKIIIKFLRQIFHRHLISAGGFSHFPLVFGGKRGYSFRLG